MCVCVPGIRTERARTTSSSPLACTHTLKHTHTHTGVNTRTRAHAHTHARAHTHTQGRDCVSIMVEGMSEECRGDWARCVEGRIRCACLVDQKRCAMLLVAGSRSASVRFHSSSLIPCHSRMSNLRLFGDSLRITFRSSRMPSATNGGKKLEILISPPPCLSCRTKSYLKWKQCCHLRQ